MLRFRVLGPLEVTDGDTRVPVESPKERALLAMLLIESGQVVTSDRLIDQLWGGSPPEGGMGALRYHVSKLRDLLEPDRRRGGGQTLVTQGGGYALELSPDQVDANRFESLVAEARLTDDPSASLKLLDEGLALWRGSAYAGFGFEEYSQGEIRRLDELRLTADEERLEALLRLGRHEEAVVTLSALTHDHPLRERLWGLLMIGLYRSGRQSEALGAFRHTRRILAEELGIDPSPELCRLEERILLQDPTLQHIPVTPHNLPAALSSFVGRETEAAHLSELLKNHRLVTLTGPGGVGKSRLAVEAARSLLVRFPDGVWMVELAPVVDPELVPQEVATAAGIVERRWVSSPTDGLVDAFGGRTILVVLDNCEHLIEAAAALTEQLLKRLPLMRIVATSRQPLRVGGEAILPVESLSFPNPDDDHPAEPLGGYAAVELFCQRAANTSPGFRLTVDNADDVARLCARLDGLPLALELAASHTRVLGPSQILDRLTRRADLLATGSRIGPARHASLEATIAWSYNTLEPTERTLFDQLAVFSGGFTLEAAEAVCAGDPIEREAILARLAGLVDISLVATAPTPDGAVRHRLLESLRDYARERLDESGETSLVRQRHAAYYQKWASRRGAPLHWPQDDAEMSEWRVETDNLRAALTWALETGDGATALSIGGAMWRFWNLEGASAEGLDWLERALSLAGSSGGLDAIVVLRGAAALCAESGRVEAAQAYDMQAIELAVGEPGEEYQLQLVSVLGNLGDKRMHLGDYPGAASLFEEALRIGEQVDHPHLGTVFFERGWNALCLDDLPAAHRFFTDAPADHDTFGDSSLWGEAILRWIEGDLAGVRVSLDAFLATGGGIEQALADGHLIAALLARDEGRTDQALEELAECLARIRHAGSGHLHRPAMLAWWLLAAATLHANLRRFELAARLAGAAAGALDNGAWVLPGWLQRDLDRHLGPVRTGMDPNDFDRVWEEGRTLTVEAACLAALSDAGE